LKIKNLIVQINRNDQINDKVIAIIKIEINKIIDELKKTNQLKNQTVVKKKQRIFKKRRKKHNKTIRRRKVVISNNLKIKTIKTEKKFNLKYERKKTRR